jgi:hypothetical protein
LAAVSATIATLSIVKDGHNSRTVSQDYLQPRGPLRFICWDAFADEVVSGTSAESYGFATISRMQHDVAMFQHQRDQML